MPKVKVGDINMYYEIHGEGEPLVLVMGYTLSSRFWYRQIPTLAREFKVVTFDNRGTGGSDKPNIAYTMDMIAGDLTGLLDVIGINKAHVFGISLGGAIAQQFAINYPDRVLSLILGCTSCGGPHSIRANKEAMEAIASISTAFQMQKMTPKDTAIAMLPWLLSDDFISNNPDLIQQHIKINLQENTPPHVFVRQGQAVMGFDSYDQLPHIKVPTLVIAGDSDKYVPVENSRLLASKIPSSELVILKNAGHLFMIDSAEETNKQIMSFLHKHPLSRQKEA